MQFHCNSFLIGNLSQVDDCRKDIPRILNTFKVGRVS